VSWFFPVAAITLWPFIVVNPAHETPRLLRHERIHLAQQRELWVLGFYAIYVWEWLGHLFSGLAADFSYRLISFEREAYAHEDDEDYLLTRESHSWRKWRV
jgi:hypothetical protein